MGVATAPLGRPGAAGGHRDEKNLRFFVVRVREKKRTRARPSCPRLVFSAKSLRYICAMVPNIPMCIGVTSPVEMPRKVSRSYRSAASAILRPSRSRASLMDLHFLSDDERRPHCRCELEALEHWLRRLIHETFSAAHGAEYLDAVDQGGRRLIKKQVALDIADRRAREPLRYQRPVDAAHLDDVVTVICNAEHWRHYFGAALSGAFPLGNEEARTFLRRLVDVRNKLSHANPCHLLHARCDRSSEGLLHEAKPGAGVQCTYNHPRSGLLGKCLRRF
jgi:hypothetical protein